MTTIRSSGWSVRPAFVEHSPTAPIALWADDVGLTQLAGIDPVAWQTSWENVRRLRLDRGRRSLIVEATIGGVRYTWRKASIEDYEEWRSMIVSHGGTIARRRPRGAVLMTVLVVLVASLGGTIAALFTHAGPSTALVDARHANLTLRDLPSGWFAASNSLLGYLIPSGAEQLNTTSTTEPSPHSLIRQVASQFEACVGVSYHSDRIYGASGQLPQYQVSSPVFASSDFGGSEVASTSQYYASSTMVARDVAQMSRHNFGSCLAQSSATLLLKASGLSTSSSASSNTSAQNWTPQTFLHGWVRGGEVGLSSLNQGSHLHLVQAIVAAGHYEVTLSALVGQWPQSSTTLSSMLDTLLARITQSSSTAA